MAEELLGEVLEAGYVGSIWGCELHMTRWNPVLPRNPTRRGKQRFRHIGFYVRMTNEEIEDAVGKWSGPEAPNEDSDSR